MIFQTETIWSNRIHTFKYISCKDIGIRTIRVVGNNSVPLERIIRMLFTNYKDYRKKRKGAETENVEHALYF